MSRLRDGRHRGFWWVYNVTLDTYMPQMSGNAWKVYTYLVRRSDQSDQAFPSYATIAEHCGIGRTTAIQSVKQLVELGLLDVEARYDDSGDPTSNLYTVRSGGADSALPRPESEPPGSSEITPPVVQNLHPNKTQTNKTKSKQDIHSMTLDERIAYQEELERDLANIRKWKGNK